MIETVWKALVSIGSLAGGISLIRQIVRDRGAKKAAERAKLDFFLDADTLKVRFNSPRASIAYSVELSVSDPMDATLSHIDFPRDEGGSILSPTFGPPQESIVLDLEPVAWRAPISDGLIASAKIWNGARTMTVKAIVRDRSSQHVEASEARKVTAIH